MIYTKKIKDAIKFSIKTHEVYQKQKRKGKDIAYITHPLTVGLILAHAGAHEDVIVAGILHDTVEDSTEEKKVTSHMLDERFGKHVTKLVLCVTEQDKNLTWDERKQEALEHIAHFSNDALLVKSADIISNTSELIDDYDRDGEKIFERFAASKEKFLAHQLALMRAIKLRWPENPLVPNLTQNATRLSKMHSVVFEK
jgi:(p)ppGpp synthase/HD superfamily hydrolase